MAGRSETERKRADAFFTGLIAGSIDAQLMLVGDMDQILPGYRKSFCQRLRLRIAQVEAGVLSPQKAGNLQYLKSLLFVLEKPSKRRPRLRVVDPEKDH